MARLNIGIGEEFPVDERQDKERGGEDCSLHRAHRHHHHHHHDHHGSWAERWRSHFSRKPDTGQDKE